MYFNVFKRRHLFSPRFFGWIIEFYAFDVFLRVLMFLNVVLEFVQQFLHKISVNGLLTMAPLTISIISAVNDIEIVNGSFKKKENIVNDTNVPLII